MAETTKRTSIVFYESWFEMLETFNTEAQLDIYRSIMLYAFRNEPPQVELTRAATYQIMAQIDRDREKYERICERRRKSAEKRWKSATASTEPEQKQEHANASNCMQMHTNAYNCIQVNTNECKSIQTACNNDNENDNDNGNEYGNGNDNGRDKSLSLKKNNIARGGAPEREKKNKGADFEPPTAAEVAAYAAENGYEVDAEYFVDFHNGNGWKVGKNAVNDWRAALRTWVKKGAEMRRTSGRAVTEEKKGPGPAQRKKFSRTL